MSVVITQWPFSQRNRWVTCRLRGVFANGESAHARFLERGSVRHATYEQLACITDLNGCWLANGFCLRCRLATAKRFVEFMVDSVSDRCDGNMSDDELINAFRACGYKFTVVAS